jgi:hypothetical protein
MRGRRKQQEEEEEEEKEKEEECAGEDEKVFNPIETLLEQGINQGDINKLIDAGFKTVESVIYSTKKTLIGVKGLSEPKVDKIIEAGKKLKYY